MESIIPDGPEPPTGAGCPEIRSTLDGRDGRFGPQAERRPAVGGHRSSRLSCFRRAVSVAGIFLRLWVHRLFPVGRRPYSIPTPMRFSTEQGTLSLCRLGGAHYARRVQVYRASMGTRAWEVPRTRAHATRWMTIFMKALPGVDDSGAVESYTIPRAVPMIRTISRTPTVSVRNPKT